MKYQNKLQFLFLLLALTIFTGQELIHPFFHAHKKSHSCCYSNGKQKNETQRIESPTEVQYDEDIKQRCPICNSVANKSIKAAGILSKLICLNSVNYSQSYEAFSFLPYSKPVSRGPPSV